MNALAATSLTTTTEGHEQLDVVKGKEGTSKEEVFPLEERFASKESVFLVEQ